MTRCCVPERWRTDLRLDTCARQQAINMPPIHDATPPILRHDVALLAACLPITKLKIG